MVDDEETAERDLANVTRWLTTIEENLDRFDCVTDVLGIPSIYIGRVERNTDAGATARVEQLNAPIQNERFYVDVRGAFTAADLQNPDTALWWDDTHFSELGHAIVAEELFSLLQPGGAVFGQMNINRDMLDLTAPMVASTCSSLDSFETSIAKGRS